MNGAIVIKVGGEILAPARAAEARALAADVARLIAARKVLFVHGGGPQTSELQKRLGQQPRMVAGRRVTDDAALEAIEMVVGGRLNIELCALLLGAGVNAVGLHGASGRLISAEKRPPRLVPGTGGELIDFGHVGDVSGVNVRLIDLLLGSGYTPVIACIGAGLDGRIYNINADVVASAVATAVDADHLVLVTSTPGVLGNVNDPTSRIARLTMSEAARAIADGTVGGGMIPKIEESCAALERGVKRVHIVGGLAPGDLEKELAEPGSFGTTLIRDR